MIGIDVFESLDNDIAGLEFIVTLNLLLSHATRARDVLIEIVGMGCTDIRNRLASLRPCGGVGGVGMDDTANVGECTIESEVRRGVRRRVEVALDNFSFLGESRRMLTGERG